MTIVVVEDCTVYLACILRILSVKPCIVKSAHINMRKTKIISCCYWLSFFRYPIKLSLHVQNKMESVGSVPLKIPLHLLGKQRYPLTPHLKDSWICVYMSCHEIKYILLFGIIFNGMPKWIITIVLKQDCTM